MASSAKTAAVEALGARDWLLTGNVAGATRRAQAADRALARAQALQAQLAGGKPDHSRRVRIGRQCVEKAQGAIAAARDPGDPAAAEQASKSAVRAADAILGEQVGEDSKPRRAYSRAWSTDRSSTASR